MVCTDSGLLRAYLDDALPAQQRLEVAAHLAACPSCRAGLAALRVSAEQVSSLLGPPATIPDMQAAFAGLRRRIDAQPLPTQRSTAVQTRSLSQAKRFWLSAVGAALAIISLLLFPPVRAAADQLLQVFRIRSVVFFPVDPARISQLQELDVDTLTLFAQEPTIMNSPAPPRDVASIDEASLAVGFTVRAPATLPGATSKLRITVRDRTVLALQANVEALRQMLTLTGIDDVTLPDALGNEPITVDVAAWVAQRYAGAGWNMELYQGRSPEVTLPDGVDLADLGRTGLRVLGMSAAEADAVSRQIDWTSTLVVPIPPQIQDVRSVTINGSDGMLIGTREAGGQGWLLYWQEGDRFYIMEAAGAISDTEVLAAANSVR
jgi:hypothetical protein